MPPVSLEKLTAQISRIRTDFPLGRIAALNEATVSVTGLQNAVSIGDRIELIARDGRRIDGEVLRLCAETQEVLPGESTHGLAIGDRVLACGRSYLAPDSSWIGRVLDPYGRPLDDAPLMEGLEARDIRVPPPAPARRRNLGPRIEAGVAAFNTFLPIVRGQRIGLFAGAGVGKSTLIGALARSLMADVVVIALIGERGREIRHFVDHVLGPDGMARAVIVAATSDRSALHRRRCALSAMTVAEHFRDEGRHVLLIADSITRFAEAHRDVALACGEPPALGGYPPSLAQQITTLAERAGPGADPSGDITAVFSVLVAGQDMDGPVADTLRGVLDGHVVLDRAIAERGRFPAIDLLRSISRSLPAAATEEENALLQDARALMAAYDRAELMIQSGLYAAGSDPVTDRAIACWPRLDAFLATTRPQTIAQSFDALRACLGTPPPD